MENQSPEFTDEANFDNHPQIALINTFCEITACASKYEGLFFLESHNFDLDAAVSTFLDDDNLADPAATNPPSPMTQSQSQSHYSPTESLSPSPSRSPSPPPASRPYSLRSAAKPRAGASGSGRRARGGGIRTLADLSRNPKHEEGSDSDPDFDPQEYFTGGEKSGMLVQDPSKGNDVDEIFNQARRVGAREAFSEPGMPSSSSRSLAGTARLLSGEVSATPQPPQVINHTITFWRNGFTIDDGPLRRMDDPENASFLESIKNSECPKELAPTDKGTPVHVNLTRKEEDYRQPKKPKRPFQGVGRTLGSTSDTPSLPIVETDNVLSTVLTTAPTPTLGLVIDLNKPCTSIQLRLADGTRMVSRFNHHHTIRDIRAFIDSARPDGPTSYQLQTMGFPPKQLANLDQTIEEAGIANSVVIQKL